MRKVKIQIKAEDFVDNYYINSDDCPITRALHRAGMPELKHAGGKCISNPFCMTVGLFPAEADEKVRRMFASIPGGLTFDRMEPLPPEDFEVEVEIFDEYVPND